MNIQEELHTRFNSRNDQIPPIRIKRFKREDLSFLLAELGLNVGAEVGVAQAIHALQMFEANPLLRLLCVDPYTKYHWKHSQDLHEEHFQEAQDKLEDYDATFIRKTSMEAAKDVPDNSLDFVYIDGNHEFDYVMQDLIEWGKKVKPGGIISGHDYYRFRRAGVVDAVDAYTKAHQVNEWFVCDEREVSFFWAKDEKWT